MRRLLLVLTSLASLVLAGPIPTHAIGFGDPCKGPLPLPGPGVFLGDPAEDDQIWGTAGNDKIWGFGGNDVLKGLGGNDIICGGPGNDGINGGAGADVLGGDTEYDLIDGASGNDDIFGGAGVDGIYGGTGIDELWGSDDGVEGDFVIGGAGDSDIEHVTIDDEYYEGDGADTLCPDPEFAKIGVYSPARLVPVNPLSPSCATISGEVTNRGFGNDGDFVFDIMYQNTTYHVEFMARDVPHFPTLNNGDDVIVTGFDVYDINHNFPPGKRELHPVYRLCITAISCLASNTYWSGPRRAGAPFDQRPANIPEDAQGTTTFSRYCWNAFGTPCTGYQGGSFEGQVLTLL